MKLSRRPFGPIRFRRTKQRGFVDCLCFCLFLTLLPAFLLWRLCPVVRLVKHEALPLVTNSMVERKRGEQGSVNRAGTARTLSRPNSHTNLRVLELDRDLGFRPTSFQGSPSLNLGSSMEGVQQRQRKTLKSCLSSVISYADKVIFYYSTHSN